MIHIDISSVYSTIWIATEIYLDFAMVTYDL